jgi:four helix bundle protein
MSFTDFKNLTVWQKSKDLAVDINKLTNTGELAKDYGLREQMQKAAVSIPSNIAEGNDRESEKEMIRYLHISKGSLSELCTQLEIAKEIAYIDEVIYSGLNVKCIEVSKMLGGLIKTLKNKSNK